MKLTSVRITENQVEVFAGDVLVARCQGEVDHTLTLERSGKMALLIEVQPRRNDALRLRPAQPPRNTR